MDETETKVGKMMRGSELTFDDTRVGDESASAVHDSHYPPVELVLRGLGITEMDLNSPQVSVNARFLRLILSELARYQQFDPDFYARTYPDIKGAHMAGEISSMQEHFVATGYFEGRLPRDLPFDPEWYHDHYADIASSFARSDRDRLRRHFFETGLREGRAGAESMLEEAERWRLPSPKPA